MADNTNESISYINVDGQEHPIDAVTINGQSLPNDSAFLPSVSSSDNGKVLRVVNGAWVLISPSFIYAGEGEPDDNNGNNGDIYIKTI
jgi:hypothetical protein